MAPDPVIKQESDQSLSLNVGGHVYTTKLEILTNGRSAKLTAMFSPASPLLRDAKGRVCIERSGERFGTVLSFLSTGTCPELPASGDELVKLLDEADFYQVAGLEDAILDSPALVRYEAELAFAAIDGPAVRYAAKLLLRTAYFAPAQPKTGWQNPAMKRTDTYYEASDLVIPVAPPHTMMIVQVFRGEGHRKDAAGLKSSPHNLSLQPAQPPPRPALRSPAEWEAVIIRKVDGDPAAGLSLPRAFGAVDSIAWCPPRSTACSAEALITYPADICFFLTNIQGIAHASWKKGDDPVRGEVAQYSIRWEA